MIFLKPKNFWKRCSCKKRKQKTVGEFSWPSEPSFQQQGVSWDWCLDQLLSRTNKFSELLPLSALWPQDLPQKPQIRLYKTTSQTFHIPQRSLQQKYSTPTAGTSLQTLLFKHLWGQKQTCATSQIIIFKEFFVLCEYVYSKLSCLCWSTLHQWLSWFNPASN